MPPQGGSVDLPQLTFLRFIAATAVVFFHFRNDVGSLRWAQSLLSNGNSAVSFFFVLSGFILAHVYGIRGISSRSDFYVARFARVVPLYWIALAAVAAYHLFKGGGVGGGALALNVALLQAWIPGYALTLNSPGWSLSVELFFYLSFPFVLAWLRRTGSAGRVGLFAILLWAASLAMHVVLVNRMGAEATATRIDLAYYHPLGHFGTFILGAAVGILFPLYRERLRAYGGWMAAVAAIASVVLLWLPDSILKYHHNGLLAPLYLMVIVGLSSAPAMPVARGLAWGPLVLLGEASYGIYILQHPVLLFYVPLAKRIHLGTDAQFWSYYLILVIVSIVMFKLVESPLRVAIKQGFGRFRSAPVTSP